MNKVVPATVDEARRRVDRIRGHVASAWEEVIAAYKHRDHEALGYGTGQAGWDAYILGEFGESRLSLPRHQRVEHVIEASSEGMSNRAIASAGGIDERTVRRDLDSQVRRNASPATPAVPTFDPDPIEVDHATGEVYRTPAPIVGMDGKTYTRPEPRDEPEPTKPRRRPITDVSRDAGWEIRKATERIEKLLSDDRFPQNKEQVATHLRGHLLYVVESCQGLLDQLD